MHLDNSFISTTLCDDLARATEAQDGKKNTQQLPGVHPYLVFVSLRFLGGMKSYCSAPRIQGACHSIGFTCSN